jgi:hypothetical protein
MHFKLSPAGGDTSRGGLPWAVLACRQPGLHRPHNAKTVRQFELFSPKVSAPEAGVYAAQYLNAVCKGGYSKQ